MEKETKCNNNYCPLNRGCSTFSNDSDIYNLETYEFEVGSESDEQPYYCDEFVPLTENFR